MKQLFALIFLMLASVGYSQTIVNSCTPTSANAAVVSCPLAAGVTAGNLLVLSSKTSSDTATSAAIPTVTSTSGVTCTWTNAVVRYNDTGGSSDSATALLAACVLPSSGAMTVQASWANTNLGTPFTDISVAEYAPPTAFTWSASPVDGTPTSNASAGVAGTSCPATNYTTTNTFDLVIAVCEAWNAAQTWGAATGYVSETSLNRNTKGWYDANLNSAGTQTFTTTISSDKWISLLAGFKLTAVYPWAGILAPPRAMDWTQAGAAHIWDARTKCASASCQAVCSDYPTCAVAKNNTAAAINAALAAAPYNTYVQLPPTSGSDTIAGIQFPAGGSGLSTCTTNCSNITLRGSGPNSTVFIFTGQSCTDSGTSAICAESSDQNIWSPAGTPSNTANWTAGYAQSGTTITLSAVTNLKVGWPIILDQLDDGADNGAFWVDCESNANCGVDGPSGFQRTGRAQFQMVNVASCTTASGAGDTTFGHACTSGTGVVITPGLYAPNWRTGQTPGAWWATSPVFNDGVENMAATYNSGVGVIFFNCTGCWQRAFKGVRTTGTPTGWFHGSAFVSNHVTFRDSYYFGAVGDSYVVGPQVASDMLIENVIAQKPSGFVYNSDCEGCVLAYAFSVDAGANAAAFLSQSHWYHSVVLYSLDEGNIGAGLYADLFHGNHVMNTAFRNRWQGKGIDGTGAPTTSGNNALILAYGARYNNFVGNIMGMPGYHNGYQSGTNVVDINTSDTAITPSTLLWANWNAGSNSTLSCTGAATPVAACPRDERAGSATTYPGLSNPALTLPASFAHSAVPSWWPNGKAWPVIGPDVTGGNVGVCPSGTFAFSDVITTVTNVCGAGITPSTLASGEVISNPAMDCYFNQMGGNALGTSGPLTFDAQCPGFTGIVSNPLLPPTGITVTPQTTVPGPRSFLMRPNFDAQSLHIYALASFQQRNQSLYRAYMDSQHDRKSSVYADLPRHGNWWPLRAVRTVAHWLDKL